MAKAKQRTVKHAEHIAGIALHTGDRVKLTLKPGAIDTGIVFRRLDLAGTPHVQAHIKNVVDTARGTTIAKGDATVHTVEHLLAGLNAFGVDNALVEMTGPEPPVGDGSALPFVEMLQRSGTVTQDAPKRFITVKEPLFYEKDGTKIMAVPDRGFRISCSVKYNSTPLDCQYQSLKVDQKSFVEELCRARTFCLFHEIEALIKANLICGGSLDNAVVIKGDAILSKEGLRYQDEFVRHKMLDIVGDYYLLGARLRGQIIAVKPGHPSNVEMARMILRQQAKTAHPKNQISE